MKSRRSGVFNNTYILSLILCASFAVHSPQTSMAEVNGSLEDECLAAVETLEFYLDQQTNTWGAVIGAKSETLKRLTDFIDWCDAKDIISKSDLR